MGGCAGGAPLPFFSSMQERLGRSSRPATMELCADCGVRRVALGRILPRRAKSDVFAFLGLAGGSFMEVKLDGREAVQFYLHESVFFGQFFGQIYQISSEGYFAFWSNT